MMLPMSPEKIGDARQQSLAVSGMRPVGDRPGINSLGPAGRASGFLQQSPTARSTGGLTTAEWVRHTKAMAGGSAWARPATSPHGHRPFTPREVRNLLAPHSTPRREGLPALSFQSNAAATASGIHDSPERTSFRITPRTPCAYNIYNDKYRTPLRPTERLGSLPMSPRMRSPVRGAGKTGWARSDMIGGHRKPSSSPSSTHIAKPSKAD
eukprot:COSAG02_NODE_2686_length_8239_cov_5.121361_6_plen_210_part_00